MANVLVGCEYSATVRDAFRRLGHNAWSCDLDPCEGNPAWHYQDDVMSCLDADWDLAIFHPPCTYLTNAGARWFVHPDDKHLPDGQRRVHPQYPNRWRDQVEAMAFFMALQDVDVPRIAIENPIPLGRVRKAIGEYTQTVQPYEFGEPATKRTCLWLKNLPPLVPTDILGKEHRKPVCHHASPGKDRGKIRSKFPVGLANAMAEQWSEVL
jgi:hypothetical protein